MFEAVTLGTVAAVSIAAIMLWKRAQANSLRAAGLAPSAPSKSGPGAVFDTRTQSGGRANHIVDLGRFGRGMSGDRRTLAGTTTPHWGVDITAPPLTPVRAALDGVVLQAQPIEGYGNAVVLSHPQEGVSTVYGHLTRSLVSPGASVTGGQMIGLVGNTCSVPGRDVPCWCRAQPVSARCPTPPGTRDMGNHLHFEVHPAVRPTFSPTYQRTDPVAWLRRKGISLVAWEIPQALLGSVQNFGDL